MPGSPQSPARSGRVGCALVIDLRLLREDPDLFRASQTARGEDPGLVDALLEADEVRRSAGASFDTLRNEQKGLGKQVARASAEDKPALLARAKELADAVKAADAQRGDRVGARDQGQCSVSVADQHPHDVGHARPGCGRHQ